MSRQPCDRPTCTEPAVTYVADMDAVDQPESSFLCAGHAPVGAEVRK